jgi:hypothetical protein
MVMPAVPVVDGCCILNRLDPFQPLKVGTGNGTGHFWKTTARGMRTIAVMPVCHAPSSTSVTWSSHHNTVTNLFNVLFDRSEYSLITFTVGTKWTHK